MPTFQEDMDAVNTHTDIRLLSDGEGRMVAVAPLLQGRVLTSTFKGPEGLSHGWVNQDLIGSGRVHPKFNAYGGEDRFWLGPEGGQFGLNFAPGVPFDIKHAAVPAALDREPFEVIFHDNQSIRLSKRTLLKNYSGFGFEVEIERTIRLLGPEEVESGEEGISWVGFESANTLTNRGKEPWRPETGLLSLWILGMFQSSPRTTVIIPFLEGTEASLGPKVNDAYFGPVPKDRLHVGADKAYFKGDSQFRSKIGVSPKRAKPFLGSWDPVNGVLTIVQYSLRQPAGSYVNSMWEIQKDPYGGDTVNSYNDGPAEPGGKQEGSYYELETSSPAAALAPGESLTHRHQTFHLSGKKKGLDPLCRSWFNASLAEVERAL